MFYTPDPDYSNLRQGDVLEGFVKISPIIKKPFEANNFPNYDFTIHTDFPKFSVIITQCCSIKESTISLAPVRKITTNIVQNPELLNNCTILNRPIETYQCIHPKIFDGMSPEQKEKIIADGKKFQYNNYFFYEGAEIFPKYDISYKKMAETYEISSQVINFNEIYQLNCDQIQKDKFGTDLLRSKRLELTIEGREDLRQKLHNFFCRRPAEDEI